MNRCMQGIHQELQESMANSKERWKEQDEKNDHINLKIKTLTNQILLS